MTKEEGGFTPLFSLAQRVAQAMTETADYLELTEESRFRIAAYRKASAALQDLHEDLAQVVAEGRVQKIPGVGKGMAFNVEHFLAHGTIPLLEELKAKLPEGLLEVAEVPGVGPKKTIQLFNELGVSSLEAFRQALEAGRVPGLKGFTERSAQKLLIEVQRLLARPRTYLKDDRESWASAACSILSSLPKAVACFEVGQVRRKAVEAPDVELLLVSNEWEVTRKALVESLALEGLQIKVGERSSSTGGGVLFVEVRHPSGCPIRIFLGKTNEAARLLLILTGPESFVEHVRGRYGGQLPEGFDEAHLLEKVGLQSMVPEIRHHEELLGSQRVDLLSTVGIQGNLHTHTTDSDGHSDLDDVVREAKIRGHAYLGITDHSRSLGVANGLSVERLLAQSERIKRLQATGGDLKVFSGTECDILENGELDYPCEILERLDYVVIAIHSYFQLGPHEMTERLLHAIGAHPKVKILAHPTGRLLTRREGYAAQWGKVFQACADHDVAVEINAHPWRLDLSDDLLELAVNKGCLISINTDAHRLEEFDYHRHGVDVARRGAVPPARVVNTWPLERLEAWFRSER